MFRRGLVFQAECPDLSCTRVNCHFLHPQATAKHTTPDSSLARESSWQQLQDLKQLPSTYHDSYTPAVLPHDIQAPLPHDDDDVHAPPALEATHDADLMPVHAGLDDTTEHVTDETLPSVHERGVKVGHTSALMQLIDVTQRKWSQVSAAELETHKRRHTDSTLTDHSTLAPPSLSGPPPSATLPHHPPPRPDVMGPRIASKKYTVDNFLGASTEHVALPISTPNQSARQRINPSSQALSSATCPIVSYTPNSHIERVVRQKVVDRLYAHLKRVNPHEAVQQSLDLELEIYRSCQGRTSYTHQARVLFSELERNK